MNADEMALLNVLARRVKEYYHQRNVYRLTLAQLKAAGVPDIDEIIDRNLENRDLLQATEHAFAFLDQRVPSIPEPDLDPALRQWLESLPPSPFSN